MTRNKILSTDCAHNYKRGIVYTFGDRQVKYSKMVKGVLYFTDGQYKYVLKNGGLIPLNHCKNITPIIAIIHK